MTLKTVFEELRDADWEMLGLQLTAHASIRLKNFSWRTGSRYDLAQLAKDLAAEAIRLVVTGRRRWEPERVALLPMLKGVVSSLISHLAQSADARSQVRFPDGEDGEELRDRIEFRAPERDEHGLLPAHPPDPDRAAALRRMEFADERLNALLDGVRDELDLVAVVEALMVVDDPTPAAVAEHLGLQVSEVNNRLKRLRRTRDRLATTALPRATHERTGHEAKGA